MLPLNDPDFKEEVNGYNFIYFKFGYVLYFSTGSVLYFSTYSLVGGIHL